MPSAAAHRRPITEIAGQAPSDNLSGAANTAFGYGVLRSNTSGDNNIAFGVT
jgi:hypothetical protein